MFIQYVFTQDDHVHDDNHARNNPGKQTDSPNNQPLVRLPLQPPEADDDIQKVTPLHFDDDGPRVYASDGTHDNDPRTISHIMRICL